MPEREQRLWTLKSKGVASSFGGNAGYADDPVAKYVYDNFVPNHNKMREGDLILVVDQKFIQGYSMISSIEVKEKVPKIVYRCPHCKAHEFYERTTIQPRYKCRKKHEFEVRDEEHIEVTEYTAHYGSHFVTVGPQTSVKLLEPFYIKRNMYYSIQSTDIRLFEEKPFEMPAVLGTEPGKRSLRIHLSATHIPFYAPNDHDHRVRKVRSVVVRQGQDRFKDELIRYYGHVCMISGCDIVETIEASHICPYRGKKDHNPRNGLLLRTDLHQLFDADLIGIDPDTMTVKIHPKLSKSYYSDLHGKVLVFDHSSLNPSMDALRFRWNIFRSMTGQ